MEDQKAKQNTKNKCCKMKTNKQKLPQETFLVPGKVWINGVGGVC